MNVEQGQAAAKAAAPALALGFRYAGGHAGIKALRRDLALIVSDAPADAAAVVTTNQVRASCTDRTARLLPTGGVRAVVVNSGNANCLAGPTEVEDDARMARAVAAVLGCEPGAVLTASTGSIGKRLPIELIEGAVPRLVTELGADPSPAAEAIQTTDRALKLASRQVSVEGRVVTLTGLAKGSGMIHPDMATMLAFVCTDAAASGEDLSALLREAVGGTFNQISVDRDTSTNDTLLLLANGRSGARVSARTPAFAEALQGVCRDLARQIAADGEGATRLIEVAVRGAPDRTLARALARGVIESNLFKSSIFGNDCGWSRALAALGQRAARLGVELRKERLELRVDGELVVKEGHPTGHKPGITEPSVRFAIDLGLGDAEGEAWGCDLSYDYVTINAVTKSDPLETHSPGLKRRLLVECLGYIKRFHGKIAVIKYGGAAMLRDDLKNAFAEDVVLLEAVGLRPVVVHGGGPEISRTLDQLGAPSRFEDGIRVTDEASVKVVEMVLSGSVNTDVVTRIHTTGGRAVGLSGKDGAMFTCRKLEVPGKEYGLVGEITEVRTEVIDMLLANRYIPVISPIGVDAKGVTYNINADTAAAKVAEALRAEKIIFLSDVPGIMSGEEKINRVRPADLEALIARGVIKGGMIPKVQAMLHTLRHGVSSAHVIDGRVPHNLLAELFTDKGVGTWITASPPP